MTRFVAGFLAAAALGAACAGGPAAAPTPAPAAAATGSPPSSDALVAEVTVAGTPATLQGGDDHLTIRVVNHGRRIERFAVERPGGWPSTRSRWAARACVTRTRRRG